MADESRPRQVNLTFTPEQYEGFQRLAKRLNTSVTRLLWTRAIEILKKEEKNERKRTQ